MIDFKTWSDVDLADFTYTFDKLTLSTEQLTLSLSEFYDCVEYEKDCRREDN